MGFTSQSSVFTSAIQTGNGVANDSGSSSGTGFSVSVNSTGNSDDSQLATITTTNNRIVLIGALAVANTAPFSATLAIREGTTTLASVTNGGIDRVGCLVCQHVVSNLAVNTTYNTLGSGGSLVNVSRLIYREVFQ